MGPPPPGPRHSAGRAHLHPHRRGGFYIRPKPGSIYPGPRWLRELGSDAPCAPLRGAVGVGAFDTSVRTVGYKIRPYKPALGFPVGAACMAARTGSRLPPGFDGPATPGPRHSAGRIRLRPPLRTRLWSARRQRKTHSSASGVVRFAGGRLFRGFRPAGRTERLAARRARSGRPPWPESSG